MTGESIYRVISEKEFLPKAQKAVVPYFRVLNLITENSQQLSKKYYSNLINAGEDVETFLDDHGAMGNLSWAYFRDLIASIRNLTISAFQIKHTVDRFPDYRIDADDWEKDTFLKDADTTIHFLVQSIRNLYEELKRESATIGLKVTEEKMDANEFLNVTIKVHLPKTALDKGVQAHEERILELTRKYRKVWKVFKEENLGDKREGQALEQVIPTKMDEKKAQKLKNNIHNVQSDYDTYVKDTPVERENDTLKKIRGYISIPLHLMESVRWLSHFFERHSDGIQSGETHKKIAKIINKWEIVERMTNFALFYSGYFLQKGNTIAESLLTSYTKKVLYDLPVPYPLGFHARPTTYISMIVNEHGTDVSMIVDGNRFNAKSVLSLMEAGGLVADLGLSRVSFEGDQRVLDDLKVLAEHNYCEECDIPRELNYLRILRNMKGSGVPGVE